jgi:hypothetical protein
MFSCFLVYLSIFFQFMPIAHRHYFGFIPCYVFLNSVNFIVNCIGFYSYFCLGNVQGCISWFSVCGYFWGLQICGWKPESKETTCRSGHESKECYIEMIFKEYCTYKADWFQMIQDRFRWPGVVNTISNILATLKTKSFLTGWATVTNWSQNSIAS